MIRIFQLFQFVLAAHFIAFGPPANAQSFQSASSFKVSSTTSISPAMEPAIGEIDESAETDSPGSGLSWVWDEAGATADSPGQAPRFFRVAFDVSGIPEEAVLQIAADNEYTAYLNGASIGSNDDWTDVDTIAVQAHIRQGRNVLAIKARNTSGPAGVIALLRITNDDGSIQLAATNSDTRVSIRVPGNQWTQPGFDDSSWVKADVLGGPEIEPWKIVTSSSVESKTVVQRELANKLVVQILTGDDAIAGNSIIQLVHLAADQADLNLFETIDPDSAPKLMETTIEIVSSFASSPSEAKRCSALNAVRLLLSHSAGPDKKELTSQILSTLSPTFVATNPGADHLQLIVISGIDGVLNTLNEKFSESATKLAAKAAEVKAKSAELKAKQLEIQALDKQLEALAGQSATVLSPVIRAKAQLKVQEFLIGEQLTTLQKSQTELAVEGESYVTRSNEILAFFDSVQSDLRSPVAQTIFDHVREKTMGYRLVFSGVGSLNKSAEFINQTPGGTVHLMEGVGGPTAATDYPSALTLPTKGDRPGVSNTAEYNSSYSAGGIRRTDSTSFDPAGKRIHRNRTRDESTVRRAPGATGAVPIPPRDQGGQQ